MSDAPEFISPVVPSPLDAYRGRGVGAEPSTAVDAPETEVSVSDLFVVALDKVFEPPTKATEAFYIFLHIIEKEVEPLLEKVKQWSLKKLNDEERVACEKLMGEGKLIETPIEVKG